MEPAPRFRSALIAVAVIAVALSSCSLDSSAKDRCATTSDCSPGYVCDQAICVLPDSGRDQQSEGNGDAGGGDIAATDAHEGGSTDATDGSAEAGDSGAEETGASPDAVTMADGEIDANDGQRDASASDGSPDEQQDAAIDEASGADAGDGGAVDASDGGSADAHQDLGEPSTPPIVYVASTTDIGGLWLFAAPSGSVTSPTMNVSPPIDVLANAGALTFVDDVEIQSVGHEVFILERSGTSTRLASVRDDTWTPWQPVATDVKAMGLANVEGYLWACLVGGNRRLRLMSRQDSGQWQDLGDVMDQATIPSGAAPTTLVKVDCAGMGADLEILAIDDSGRLWHATKSGDAWARFRAVDAGVPFVDIDVCNAAGDLHLLAGSADRQWHTILPPGTNSVVFMDVAANGGDPMGNLVAGGLASLLTEVDWVRLSSLGEIWMGTRFRTLASPFMPLATASPDGHPFVSVSATGVLP